LWPSSANFAFATAPLLAWLGNVPAMLSSDTNKSSWHCDEERFMEYRPLGKTGLTVSVVGLGCGGNSRLGLGRGASVDDCVAIVRTAVDLGVNFLDTAEAYGTEEIVGIAARSYDRDRLVISTKAICNTGDTADTVT